MKRTILTSIAFAAVSLVCPSLSAQEAPKPLPISELKDDTSVETIYRSYVELRRDEKASDESKASQAIRLLVIAQNYLSTHSRPEGVIQSQVQPPDGGIPGVSPESVKDPQLRAQYVKMIEENNAKAEKQQTYDSFQTLRNDILTACIAYTNAKSGNSKVISEAIAQYSKDAEQTSTLKQAIVDKAIEQKKQPPNWQSK